MMEFPLISCVQKVVIYETKARLFIVGSNSTETKFRVLKIDRTEPKELHITDDGVIYSPQEIRQILLMIDVGNRPKILSKGLAGLSRTASAFGIVGFVRFLEGYYIILITKRRKVAQIGHHTIYKIEDTATVYIPNDTVRYSHPDEQKYLKLFQNVDLSSNFYFSYSYDLTHTLQYNLTPSAHVTSLDLQERGSDRPVKKETGDKSTPATEAVESASDVFKDIFDESPIQREKTVEQTKSQSREKKSKGKRVYGTRYKPVEKFVWNRHLLRHMEGKVHPDWLMYISHGFIAQHNVCVFGKPIYISLIARRSSHFAGTRFLKRGTNCKGYVANEVETEQIVNDASVLPFHRGRYSSYVQIRGSIPSYWSQDISKMIPKPPITVDQADPYHCAAGQHFCQVLHRYGAPIIILNLVKKHEKKRQESILSDELVSSIQYLNQFLPPQHKIKYIGFDMARVSKRAANRKNSNVLLRLAEIAEYCVKCTGFFQTGSSLYCNQLQPHSRWQGMQWHEWSHGHKQHGVVRTNCVDCLDRTNTAQFAVGKCALAFQLYSLGIIESPSLDLDTDCVRMLEELYEDQGDTLALQYGGSQLVHRVKDYRRLAPLTSSSRDIMQTLSRYYSNAFSDAEKQHSINLFLGVFEPSEGSPSIWELPTDFYLHNPSLQWTQRNHTVSYSQWWTKEIRESLPLPAVEEFKGSHDDHQLLLTLSAEDELVDSYREYYQPQELTSMEQLFSFHMPNSIRDYMPKFSSNYSPFDVRARPGRRKEESSHGEAVEANPNISGKESTSSILSTGSESSTSSSEGSDLDGDIDILLEENELPREDSTLSMVSLKDLFPTMRDTYGVEILEPAKQDISVYKRYVQIGQNSQRQPVSPGASPNKSAVDMELFQTSVFPLDSSHQVEPPTVSQGAKEIYETYVHRGQHGASVPSNRSLRMYQNYIQSR